MIYFCVPCYTTMVNIDTSYTCILHTSFLCRPPRMSFFIYVMEIQLIYKIQLESY